MKPLAFLLLFALQCPLIAQRDLTTTNQPKRIALLIGNANYQHATKLSNTLNDVTSMESALRQLGFDVISVKDATLRDMDNRLDEFTTRIETGRYAVALCFYSGHGLQVNGENYLVPTDANPQREADVRYSCLNAQRILDRMEGARAATKILLLDACRNNPLPKSWGRTTGGGLAFMQAPQGTFIGFATAPGTIASDGTGRNSPYTSAILKHLNTPGLDIHQVFTRVASVTQELAAKEGKTQTPYISSNLTGDFYFANPVQTNPNPATPDPDDSAKPDSDHDGVPDAADKCPDEYGTLNGCPDSDGDGITDASDGCPFEKGVPGNRGCPQAPVIDSDNDGVLDGVDKCPQAYGKKEWQGCPDSDGDNVPDHKDNCPNQFGLASLNGCPDPNNANTYTDPLGGTFVKIKGGTFDMGSDNGSKGEKPVHRVTLSDFYMGKFEVTLAQFKSFIDDTGYNTDAEKNGDSYVVNSSGSWEEKSGVNWRHDEQGNRRPTADYNRPVVHVSHNDATAYAEWLSRKTGERYRLPTEAEWEYAAGNGTRHTKYSWGNGDPIGKKGGNVADETAKRQYSGWSAFEGYTDGYVFSAPVGAFDPNELGLHDMTGNVWEWCQDWKGDYPSGSQTNPTGATSGSNRVIRGGSWGYDPTGCRVAFRFDGTPVRRNNRVGFRLARTF